MSYILSINISHNPSICLLKDNEVVLYQEDPLPLTGIYENHTQVVVPWLDKVLEKTSSVDSIIFASFRRFDIKAEEAIINTYKDLLRNITYKRTYFYPEHHHLYHAIKVFKESKFNNAVAVITDGSGSYLTGLPRYREIESIYSLNSTLFKSLYKHYSNFSEIPKLKYADNTLLSNKLSAGQLFCEVASSLYRGPIAQSKKVMDLSLKSNKEFTSTEYIQHTKDYSYINLTRDQAINLVNNTTNKKDLAKQIQHETKVHTCNLIQKAINLTNNTNVVLSGGYFLNSVNNIEYIKEFPNVNFYIDPVAHDGGTSVGAAYYLRNYHG